MIKSDCGYVTIKGNTAMVLAEVSTLIHSLYEIFSEKHTEDEAKAMIMESVELALASKDELDKRQEESLGKLKGMLEGIVNDLFEGIRKGE